MKRIALALCALVLAALPSSAQINMPTPAGAVTAVNAAATGTTGAVTATLAAAATKTTYLCGFSISPGSATAAITLTVQVAGIASGVSLTWAVGAPVTAAGTTGANFTQTFFPCLASSNINTAITVTSGALGAGGVNNDVNAWGFQQ